MDDVELAGTIATVVSTAFGISVYVFEKIRKRHEKAPESSHALVALKPMESLHLAPCKKFASEIAEWFKFRFDKFEAFAQTDALRGSDPDLQHSVLDQITREVPGFPGGIYVIKDAIVNNQHTPLAPEVPNIAGYIVTSRPYYEECQMKLKSIASEVFLSANRKIQILVVATPLFSDKGHFIGILDGVVDIIRAPFSYMAKQTMKDFGFHESHPKTRLVLIDGQKVVMGSSHGEVDGRTNLSSDPIVVSLLSSLSQDHAFSRHDGSVCRVDGTNYFAICYDVQ